MKPMNTKRLMSVVLIHGVPPVFILLVRLIMQIQVATMIKGNNKNC